MIECLFSFVIPPTKPDYLAVRGLAILKKFREQYSAQGFAEMLGVLINLKDGRIASEEDWHAKLRDDPENRCFESYIPRRAYIQRAADFDMGKRTYIAKYPGDAGQSIRAMTKEVLTRLAEWAKAMPVKPPRQAPAGRGATATSQRVVPPPERAAAPPPPRPAAASAAEFIPEPQIDVSAIPTPGLAPAANGQVLPHMRVATPVRPAATFSSAMSAVSAALESSARSEGPRLAVSDGKPAK